MFQWLTRMFRKEPKRAAFVRVTQYGLCYALELHDAEGHACGFVLDKYGAVRQYRNKRSANSAASRYRLKLDAETIRRLSAAFTSRDPEEFLDDIARKDP